jgi:K+-transporting ATPase KdpF subunit
VDFPQSPIRNPNTAIGNGWCIVIWLTVLITLFLFGYLLAALLRPEWF